MATLTFCPVCVDLHREQVGTSRMSRDSPPSRPRDTSEACVLLIGFLRPTTEVRKDTMMPLRMNPHVSPVTVGCSYGAGAETLMLVTGTLGKIHPNASSWATVAPSLPGSKPHRSRKDWNDVVRLNPHVSPQCRDKVMCRLPIPGHETLSHEEMREPGKCSQCFPRRDFTFSIILLTSQA